MDNINVLINGKNTIVEYGTTISDVLKINIPCGGHGRCGKCKIIASGNLSEITDSEKSLLSKEEINLGYRLACSTKILGESSINTLKEEKMSEILLDNNSKVEKIEPLCKKYGIALDIGTTTLAMSLVSNSGEVINSIGESNPQSVFGSDVISRIEASLAGKNDDLQKIIVNEIEKMALSIVNKINISIENVDMLVITGNTSMLYFLTNTSPEPLSHAPFELSRRFGEFINPKDLGFNIFRDETRIYLPPCISAFVGADTVCAILADDLCSGKSKLLADIGTNGEMALFTNGKIFVCSTAAGPAFEGVGISKGMQGINGAIDKVYLVNNKIEYHVIGDNEPIGICGSGLIDAVASFLQTEDLDETGFIEDDELFISNNVSLTNKDIRMVQLAKSAICAGLLTLIDNSKLDINEIESLDIAGGFGNYLNKENACIIGLLPKELLHKTKNIGNAALGGALMILKNRNLINKVNSIVDSSVTLDLASNKFFSDAFINGMLF